MAYRSVWKHLLSNWSGKLIRQWVFMNVYGDNSGTVNWPSGFREDWNVNSLATMKRMSFMIDDKVILIDDKRTHDPDIQAKLKIILRWLMGFRLLNIEHRNCAQVLKPLTIMDHENWCLWDIKVLCHDKNSSISWNCYTCIWLKTRLIIM